MKTDIQKLEALAKGATPGPWVAGGSWVSTAKGGSVAGKGASIADCARGDQHFIAAANPATVLELIAELKALRSQVATLQAAPDSWQSGYDEGRKMGTKTALSEREHLKAEVADLADLKAYVTIPLRERCAQRLQLQDENATLHGKIDRLLAHCSDGECATCGEIICPHGGAMHFHHDGCPSCAEHQQAEQEQQR